MLRAICAILLGLTLATAASAAPPPKTVTFAVKAGTVTFNHEAHGKRSSCKECHPAGPTKLKGKDQAHATCMDCHKAKKAGPMKCADCHKKA